MKVEAYLARIGCEGSVVPTPDLLFRLQRRHLQSVPYETFDLWQGRAPGLTPEELYEKIVVARRGGYCFELNGAFKWLLQRLGYKVHQRFGRWLFAETLAVPPPRHRVLMVEFAGLTYLVDVAVGMRTPIEPLELKFDVVQKRGTDEWRLVRDAHLGSLLQLRVKDAWRNYYAFGEDPAEDADFLYVNHYLATSPTSPFRRAFWVNLHHDGGGFTTILPEEDPATGALGWCCRHVAAAGAKVEQRFLRTERARAEVLTRVFGLPADLARV